MDSPRSQRSLSHDETLPSSSWQPPSSASHPEEDGNTKPPGTAPLSRLPSMDALTSVSRPASSRRPGSRQNPSWFSPPGTPASNVFATPRSATPASELTNGSIGYFPDSSVQPHSFSDLSRLSTLFGRMPTAEFPSSGIRGSFASPRLLPIALSTSTVGFSSKPKDRLKSTLLEPGTELPKPWLAKKDPFVLVSTLLTYGFLIIGAISGAVRCFFGYMDVPMMHSNLCPVLDQDFSNGEVGVFGDQGTFFREVDMSGFGNGEFAMTTASPKNSFVRNDQLYLMPTLTHEEIGLEQVFDGGVYNISDCTYNTTHGSDYTTSSKTGSGFYDDKSNTTFSFDQEEYLQACSAVSNKTTGSVINPVQSARLTTRYSANIKFGKVEIRAKLPRGDWLWPALWMLPTENVYGKWPLSGEIDILESRGNGPQYKYQGANYVRGSLNWGPMASLNSVWRTYGWWSMRRGTYADDFHTYSLEWDENFMRIYVDTRLHHLLDLRFSKSFWTRGEFPDTIHNDSQVIALQNPWANGTTAAPFDQSFFLIISLGVGGTNGWFPDDKDKPWVDWSRTAMRDFLNTRADWFQTWSPASPDDRAFIIDSVKMWQKC
ncbi:concanavalin A-like lectin/glucanase domain-containing protein [Flagelloscypha sp. PMI_526]|nr:concanavalin A-like lectin/glucanase domain-containing protein [Flagelloscypha sp. PMI_526]